MKIKFEIKSSKASDNPLYTIYMEHAALDRIEFLITKLNIHQLELGQNAAAQQNIPLDDGVVIMNRDNLKKFIAALQLLAKS